MSERLLVKLKSERHKSYSSYNMVQIIRLKSYAPYNIVQKVWVM